LYQRWIYRVDPSRVNEFGVSQQMLEERQNAPSDGNVAAIEGAAAVSDDVAVSTPQEAKPLEDKKNE
jgi:hypothetical protein